MINLESFKAGTFDQLPVDEVVKFLQQCDEAYFNDNGQELIADELYDTIKAYARTESPAHPYFTGIGSSVRGGKVDLPYKMGSLNQVYQGDFTKWVGSKHRLVVSDKLDGASVMLVYSASGELQIAYSRGDGVQGADITRHVRQIHNVPHRIANNTGSPITIRAENIIPPAKFKAVNTGKYARGGRIYKNPRNMVSGLMNSSENHESLYTAIDTVVYEVVGSAASKQQQLQQLSDWGFDVVRYSVHEPSTPFTDQTLTDLLNTRRSTSVYELDGVVIEIDDADVRASMRTDDLNPLYAVKYKVADTSNFAVATVTRVEWNLSKDGYYKPRVQIEPVTLMGVTIQNLTGFNAKFIVDGGIGPGAKINITRSGDVIPFILGTVERVKPQLPDDQTAVWTDTGVDLVLADASSNDTVKFEQLDDFFATLNVMHLGEGNLRKMFDMGFETPEEIILLSEDDMCRLVESKSIGKKIYQSLTEKLTNVDEYQLMGAHPAFGRGVGVRKMKKLYEAFNGDRTKMSNIDEIVAVEGFDSKTATKVVAGYQTYERFLAAVASRVSLKPFTGSVVGPLTGKTFVFTGFRNAELEKQIVKLGGAMGSGVSRKTSYLVMSSPDSTSSKAIKAADLGVTVISVPDLITMLKGMQ